MEKLFEYHDNYMSLVPMDFIRGLIDEIDWSSRLLVIKGPKGVGKSTLMLQYIKKNYSPNDRHVLYCSADTSYFSTHTLVEVADRFVKMGGVQLFIDEVHKYPNWSREIKEIYDLYRNLRVVLSGSSLIQINDGGADLSRRMMEYNMPGLSYREYLWLEAGIHLPKISLGELLSAPNDYCMEVKSQCRPLEFFSNYLQRGYYPFYFENKKTYPFQVENVVNYIVNTELTVNRRLEVGNARKVKALLQIISQMVPYEVDIKKLSTAVTLQRLTVLNYLRYLEEANLLRRLFVNLSTITDLQKPDKILMDNPNLLYVLSNEKPQIGTVRECFFCNQLASAGHLVEYGGIKTGDYKIDGKVIVEVGGLDKGFSQVKNEENAYVAADDIETALFRKIPLWAFGCLY
ncbi:MAG: ATP-binding protein [Paludibacteraceae bacterium]|nr:ATP-binding protein [Paludibacteraceae bacterium]